MVKTRMLVDDPKMKRGWQITDADIRLTIERILQRQSVSQRALAKDWGMSPAYLSDFLSGNRPAGPRILDALGLEKVVRVRYRLKKEMTADA